MNGGKKLKHNSKHGGRCKFQKVRGESILNRNSRKVGGICPKRICGWRKNSTDLTYLSILYKKNGKNEWVKIILLSVKIYQNISKCIETLKRV